MTILCHVRVVNAILRGADKGVRRQRESVLEMLRSWRSESCEFFATHAELVRVESSSNAHRRLPRGSAVRSLSPFKSEKFGAIRGQAREYDRRAMFGVGKHWLEHLPIATVTSRFSARSSTEKY